MSALSEVAKAITPGGRVGDATPVGKPGGKQNWVDRAGGLPTYIREVAHAFMRKGKTESAAIRMAVGVIRNWAEGKGNVSAKVRAAAQATIARWEAMKGAAHVTKFDESVPDKDFEEITKALICECGEIKKGCGCSKGLRMPSDMHVNEDVNLDKPKKKRKKKTVSKRDFSSANRRKLQQQGKTDSHGGFPLEKPVDVKNAVRAIGRAKNPELEKRRIKAAAKKMGCEQYIPDSWISKAHFDPKEPRDWHGRWIHLGGGSKFAKIGAWEMEDGTHGVFASDKKTGKPRTPIKTFKSKQAAINFVQREAEKSGGKSSARGSTTRSGASDVSRSFSQFMSGDEKGARRTIRSGIRSRNIQSTASSAGKKTGDFSVGDKVQLVNVRNKKFAGKTASVVEHTGNFLTLQMPNGDRVRVGLNQIQRVKKSLDISDEEFEAAIEEVDKEFFDADSNADIFDFSLEGEIEKSDPEKQMVFGWCSIAKDKDGNEVVDKQGDVLDDIDQMEKVAYDFVLHSRDGGEMHIRKGVSTLVESFVSTPEKWAAMGIPEGTLPVGWWVGFKVNDSKVWKAVKDGKYRMFSVHGSGTRKAYEDA